jgi:hypothetical protein
MEVLLLRVVLEVAVLRVLPQEQELLVKEIVVVLHQVLLVLAVVVRVVLEIILLLQVALSEVRVVLEQKMQF